MIQLKTQRFTMSNHIGLRFIFMIDRGTAVPVALVQTYASTFFLNCIDILQTKIFPLYYPTTAKLSLSIQKIIAFIGRKYYIFIYKINIFVQDRILPINGNFYICRAFNTFISPASKINLLSPTQYIKLLLETNFLVFLFKIVLSV